MMKFVLPLLLLATFLYEANGTLEKKAWTCGDAAEPTLTGSGVGDYKIAITNFPPGCEYTLGGVDDVPYGASISYDKKDKDVNKQKFRLKALMGGEVAKFKYSKKATVLPSAYFTIENWNDLKKLSKEEKHAFDLKVTLVQTANCHMQIEYNDADVAETAISIPAISGKDKGQYCLYYWKPKSGNGAKKVTVTVAAGEKKAKNCKDGYMAHVSNYNTNQAFLNPTMKCSNELGSVVGAAADKHIAVLIYRKKNKVTDLSIKYSAA